MQLSAVNLAFLGADFFLGAETSLLGVLIYSILVLKDRCYMISKLLLTGNDLRGGYVVILGYLLNALFALDCFSGDAGMEFCSEVSYLSCRMSDFGVIFPFQTSQSFNEHLAPFCGTTSKLIKIGSCKLREWSLSPARHV